jgi:hypothetical protein
MNALKRSYQALRSITYDPMSPAGLFFLKQDPEKVHTRFFSDGEYTNILYRGESFSMRAHWLVAWITFRIIRKLWKKRSIK